MSTTVTTRKTAAGGKAGDSIFSGLSLGAGVLILAVLAAVALFLFLQALPTFQAPAEEIIVEKGRAVGVVASGKAWRAPQVIAGVNPRLLFQRLLPAGAVPETVDRHMRNWSCESATFRMNVALSELPRFTAKPEVGDHLTGGIIIAPSLAYMDRAHDDAKQGGWSKQPIVEMLIPSTLDPSLAPPGTCRRRAKPWSTRANLLIPTTRSFGR